MLVPDVVTSQACVLFIVPIPAGAMAGWWEREGRHHILAFSPGEGIFPDSTCLSIQPCEGVLKSMNSPIF